MTTKPTNPKDTIGIRKVPMSVVPANVMAELAVALLEGACKYGRHNYRVAGIRGSVYYDAAMRHLMDWWEGIDHDQDPKSAGLSHITKAIASLVVLRDAMMCDMMTDDRPPKSKPFVDDLNRISGEVIDKNADKSPEHYVENRDKNGDEKSTLENYSTLLAPRVKTFVSNKKLIAPNGFVLLHEDECETREEQRELLGFRLNCLESLNKELDEKQKLLELTSKIEELEKEIKKMRQTIVQIDSRVETSFEQRRRACFGGQK